MDRWTKTLEYLKGKKTYIVGFLVVVVGALHTAGLINDQWFTFLETLLAGLGAATLRAGIQKLSNQPQDSSVVFTDPAPKSTRTMHD